MTLINNIHSKTKRRILRKDQTPEEDLLWRELRNRKSGLKWRRQVSVGAYVVDFYCHEKKNVIELDGIQHSNSKAIEYDKIRSEFLSNKKIIVIRITNKEIRAAETLSTIVERVVREADRVRFT